MRRSVPGFRGLVKRAGTPGQAVGVELAEQRRRIDPEGVRRMARELGIRSTVAGARRLGGGMASATHLVRFGDGAEVVVKRYPAGDQLPQWEGRALELARVHGLAAPTALGVDEGRWFGTPAIAMSRLEGRTDLRPRDGMAYARRAADLIASVHAVPATSAVVLSRGGRRWDLPAVAPPGLLSASLATEVLDALRDQVPRVRRRAEVLNHGDLHPGNVLSRRGVLTGLVDWSHARPGDRWSELAYFRVELAMLVGAAEGAELLRAYEVATGVAAPPRALAVCDLHCAFNAHRWAAHWLPGYREHGRSDLVLPALRSRLRRFTLDALGRVARSG